MATLKELLASEPDYGAELVSNEYSEDEKQLAARDDFRAMVWEIPADADLGPDLWGFQMTLNDQCRAREIPFRFIGTPVKALRIIREE